MTVDTLVSNVEKNFLSIQNHPKYIIRSRIYNGGGTYGSGLRPIHERYSQIVKQIPSLPEESRNHYQPRIIQILKKINETLDLFVNYDSSSLEETTVKKFIQVSEVEVNEFEDLIEEIQSFDSSKIKSPESLKEEKIQDLKDKISDNIEQIPRSFAWKQKVAELSRSVDGVEKINQWKDLLSSAVEIIDKLQDEHTLTLLSVMSMHFRDMAARNLDSLDYNISLLKSLGKIFSKFETNDVKPELLVGGKLTMEVFRIDLEHMLNTDRLAWLASIHNFYVVEGDEGSLWNFAREIYKMHRDPRDQYEKILTIVARSQNNKELDDVTVKYAELASVILSLRGRLEELNLLEFTRRIDEIEEMDLFEGIDMDDLYHPENIDSLILIESVHKQVELMKELAIDLLVVDEIAQDLLMMVQFTAIDEQVETLEELVEYFKNY